jgi:hypothetical protein
METPDDKIDIAKAKLTFDKIYDPKTDIEASLKQIDRMAQTIRAMAGPSAPSRLRLSMLRKYIYERGPWNDNNPETTSGAYPARDVYIRQNMPMTDQAIANGIYMKTLQKGVTGRDGRHRHRARFCHRTISTGVERRQRDPVLLSRQSRCDIGAFRGSLGNHTG